MKNFSSKFSKLFLASLFASSLMLAGCGGSNPTSSSTKSPEDKTPTNAVAETSQLTIKGNITSNELEIPNAVTVKLTNKATNSKTGEVQTTDVYVFANIEPGIYEIEASGSGYDTYKTCLEILSSQTINIDLVKSSTNPTPEAPKLYFQGKLQDISGNSIPFATVKIEKNGNVITGSTEFNSDNFTLLALSSGTYLISFSKDSFQPIDNMKLEIKDDYILFGNQRIEKNNFGNTVTITDAAGNSHAGYKFSPIYMSPELNETGSLAGALTGYTAGTKCLLYKSNDEAATIVPGVVLEFTPRNDGYFFIKNLQPGWYTVVKYDSPAPTMVTDASGNSLGYKFITGAQYFHWLQVINNKTTPVPYANNY